MNMEEVGTENCKCELDCVEDLSDELEERTKKSEARIVELELEIEKRKKDYEELEAKFRVLESQLNSAELELKTFRTGNNEIREHGDSAKEKNKVGFRGGEEEGVVVDLTRGGDGENVIDQLMIEIGVLEREKRKAESEVVHWKEKFKESELQVSRMNISRTVNSGKLPLDDIVKDERRPVVKDNMDQLLINEKSVVCLGATSCVPCKGSDNLPASGTLYKDSPCSHTPLAGKEGTRSNLYGKYRRKVRRLLSFDAEKNAPMTPGISTPSNFNVINISESDDESYIDGTPFSISNDQEDRKANILTEHAVDETSDGKKEEIFIEDCEEYVNECSEKIPRVLTSKRKRVAKVVTSDTESDDDDNIPISQLKKIHNQRTISAVANSDANGCKISQSPININVQCVVTPSRRRRLVTLRQREEKVKAEKISSNMTSELKQEKIISISNDVDDEDESEKTGSEGEGESSDSFINDRVDPSEESSADKIPSHSESDSDGNGTFVDILCKLQRSKDRKLKWEFEADMLSAFGKDLELCMRAVCALYRQQTSDEQVNKEAKYENRRGFSKFDAFRGTNLAEFLTEGDPQGDLKKSKQQLEERGSGAVELCRTLATHYSKQLFEIYKNEEDPLFLPC